MEIGCPPHPEACQTPSRPSVQELDRLQMKSQLEGAGLGLPLQGGAQGHNPGNRQPRREDAFCEGTEGKHTYSSIEREGQIQTPAEASHVAGSWKTEAHSAWRPFLASPQRPITGGAQTWTGARGRAWGTEGPRALGERGLSQVL